MSLEKINQKIEKLKADQIKAEQALQKRMSSLIQSSGLLDVQISEKELKQHLKSLAEKLKNQPPPPNKENQ